MKFSIFNFQKEVLYIFLPCVCFVLLLPLGLSAASIELKARTAEIEIGSHLVVDVLLDTEGAALNAVEGTLIFPGNVFSVSGINDGDSVVSIWVEPPTVQKPCAPHLCEITFKGIIPGGFDGVVGPFYTGTKPGKLFRVILRAEESDIGIVYMQDGRAYLHDGEGTLVETRLGTIGFESLPVLGDAPQRPAAVFAGDTTPPEPFMLEVVQDTSLFEGAHALIFSAQDKGSGIAQYEVREGQGEFTRARSPYRLQNQELSTSITVRAYDRAGNVREASLAAPIGQSLWKNFFFWFAMLAVALVLLWLFGVYTWGYLKKNI